MRADAEQAASFFRMLYGEHVCGFIEIRTLPDRHQYFVRDTSAATSAVLASTTNTHFGVGLRKIPKGGDLNVLSIPAVWVEFDAKDYDDGRHGAAAHIAALAMPPTIIISSGNGFHCYWKLRAPERIIDPARACGHIKGFASACGGDVRATNIERLLRVPGTWNLKDEANPKPVRLLRHYPERLYDFGDFAGYWCEPTVAGGGVKPASIDIGPSGVPPFKFFVEMERSPRLRDLWAGKKNGGDASRSGMDFSLAKSLCERRFSDDDIARVLLSYRYGKAQQEPWNYVEYTIAKARRYAKPGYCLGDPL